MCVRKTLRQIFSNMDRAYLAIREFIMRFLTGFLSHFLTVFSLPDVACQPFVLLLVSCFHQLNIHISYFYSISFKLKQH